MIVSGVAGAFFLRRQGGLREKQTWGRAARLVVLGTDCDPRELGRGVSEGKGAGCEERIGPATATGAGEAADPGKVAALLKKKMSSEDAGSQGDRLGVMPARPL